MMHSRWTMTEPGAPMVLESFSIDAIPDDHVLVEIAGCGVCHTDLGYYYDGVRTNHALPLTLGHEISGTVVEAGRASRDWLGRSVVVPAVIPCGACRDCQAGRGNICRNQKMPGNDIQGGFGTHVLVPAHGLCPVDTDRLAARGLSLADVSIVADALTTPYQAAVQAGVAPGDLVIVVGIGGVGGYAVQIAAALGATVVAIDVVPEKLAAIAEHGASLTLNARELDARAIKAALKDFARAQGIEGQRVIMECSGTPQGQETAFGLLTHGATLCVVGFTMAKVEIRLSNLMAFHARALGNWGCVPELYPGALDLVLDGKVNLKPFIEQRPLSTINEVFHAVHAGELRRRAILVPDQ
jgi:6-hydroxycyclohex-1-ene-1-carbonyl-CoA dehydrogenase